LYHSISVASSSWPSGPRAGWSAMLRWKNRGEFRVVDRKTLIRGLFVNSGMCSCLGVMALPPVILTEQTFKNEAAWVWEHDRDDTYACESVQEFFSLHWLASTCVGMCSWHVVMGLSPVLLSSSWGRTKSPTTQTGRKSWMGRMVVRLHQIAQIRISTLRFVFPVLPGSCDPSCHTLLSWMCGTHITFIIE